MPEREYKSLDQGYPPGELYKIQALNRRDYALECISAYYKMLGAGSQPPTHFVTSSILSLFFDLEPTLKKHFSDQEFLSISKDVYSSDVDKVIMAFRRINELMLDLGITLLTEPKGYTADFTKLSKDDDSEVWLD
jgi:hypothetical protein